MKPAAQLCVARHGETDWNTQGILQGWTNVPINEQGRCQAESLAAAFVEAGFVAVGSSPLSRALETARIIAAALGLPPPFCHDGLKERNFGVFQGVPKAELAASKPELLTQILKRNPATEFAAGETMDEFADRVLSALAQIGAAHAGQRVLLITHGWVMDVITRQIQGLPRSAILDMKRKNGESIWLEVAAAGIAEASGSPWQRT